MRPLTVGAGVIKGMDVLLFANIEDIIEDVSADSVEDAAVNAESDELAPVEFVTATAIFWSMAAFAPDMATVELAEDFKKQLTAPEFTPG